MTHLLNPQFLFSRGTTLRVNGRYNGGGAPIDSSGSMVAIGSYPWLIFTDGKYFFQDNPWNVSGLTLGSYSSDGGTTYTLNVGIQNPPLSSTAGAGAVKGRIQWGFPRAVKEVKAYPSFIAGNRPGWSSSWINPGGYSILLPDGVTASAFPSGKTPFTQFPVSMASISNGSVQINTTFNWIHHTAPTGSAGGHLAFDIWFQNDADQRNGFSCPPITHELMIPVTYWGSAGGYGRYPNRNPAWYVTDTTIQGVLWHCYYAPNFNGAWVFIVFEPDHSAVSAATIPHSLEIGEFIRFADSQGWFSARETVITNSVTVTVGGKATHLVAVEFGIEPVDGTGDLTISGFSVTVV